MLSFSINYKVNDLYFRVTLTTEDNIILFQVYDALASRVVDTTGTDSIDIINTEGFLYTSPTQVEEAINSRLMAMTPTPEETVNRFSVIYNVGNMLYNAVLTDPTRLVNHVQVLQRMASKIFSETSDQPVTNLRATGFGWENHIIERRLNAAIRRCRDRGTNTVSDEVALSRSHSPSANFAALGEALAQGHAQAAYPNPSTLTQDRIRFRNVVMSPGHGDPLVVRRFDDEIETYRREDIDRIREAGRIYNTSDNTWNTPTPTAQAVNHIEQDIMARFEAMERKLAEYEEIIMKFSLMLPEEVKK